VSFNTVMAAFKTGNQWKRSLELLREMELEGVEPDLISFNTAMWLCGRAGKWQLVRTHAKLCVCCVLGWCYCGARPCEARGVCRLRGGRSRAGRFVPAAA
jgi:pentatricopeptide repeat protein